MAFTLDKVVPWGRSFGEYARMFALTGVDLVGRVLDCGGRPASFGAETAGRGGSVVACDPLYQFGGGEIRQRVDTVYPEMMEQARRNHDDFVWEVFATVEALGAARMAAMEIFLADYEDGKRAGRYVAAALPGLPFADGAFDLALCSHLLFVYTEQLTEAFHVAAIREMVRVAGEARVFPLIALGSVPSRHVESVTRALASAGLDVSIEKVDYEFPRGGDEMMRVRGGARGDSK